MVTIGLGQFEAEMLDQVLAGEISTSRQRASQGELPEDSRTCLLGRAVACEIIRAKLTKAATLAAKRSPKPDCH